MSPAKKKPQPSFEQKLAALEELVTNLESGELSLEQGVERYGEGVELLKDLFTALSSAEHKVEELSAILNDSLKELDRVGDDDDSDQ